MVQLFISKLIESKHKFAAVVLIACFYVGLSFVYSLIGFIHIEVGVHYHEYSPTKLIIEVTGHFLFGFIASLPLLDFDLSLLTGSLAILIDADHIMDALGFDVSGRPDHSFLYIIVSAAILVYLARRLGIRKKVLIKILFVAPITLFSHLAYDIFASTGTNFPLLIPFSFQEVYFDISFWIVFESIAFLIAILGYLAVKRWAPHKVAPISQEQSARARKGDSQRDSITSD